MEKITDSDTNSAMLASNVFNKIIDQIQSSNLNFHLQISPFSAKISLKKSLIRGKAGALLLPPDRIMLANKNDDGVENLAAKNVMLEEKLFLLENNYQQAVNDSAKADEMINILECKVVKAEAHALEIYNDSQSEIDTLKESNKALQTKINEYELEISDLKRVKGSALEASAKLNKDLNDYKLKFSTEKDALKKEHKEEVKALKNSIGQANKEKINMKNNSRINLVMKLL